MNYLNTAQPSHQQEYYTLGSVNIELNELLRNTGVQEPVVNPQGIALLGAGNRELNMGHQFCNNRAAYDVYGREVSNFDTIKYATCPGFNPEVAIMRDQMVQRPAWDQLSYYSLNNVPYGLKM
jgi:hypothetical protein